MFLAPLLKAITEQPIVRSKSCTYGEQQDQEPYQITSHPGLLLRIALGSDINPRFCWLGALQPRYAVMYDPTEAYTCMHGQASIWPG